MSLPPRLWPPQCLCARAVFSLDSPDNRDADLSLGDSRAACSCTGNACLRRVIPIGGGAIVAALGGKVARRGLACHAGMVLCVVGFALPKRGEGICVEAHE